MTKRFLSTLAVCLLGLIATKAQPPFTGTVEYEFVFEKEAPKEQPKMILEYRPRYLKLIAFALKDTITGQYEHETEMVIDYESGKTYQVIPGAKKIILREKTSSSVLPQMTLLPGQQKTIVGIKANLYQTKIDEFHSYNMWFADSINVAMNDVLSKNSDFFIFGTGKLLLRVEPDTTVGKKKKGEDLTINAVKITPIAFNDSSYQLTPNYTVEDESALKRMQDSLMREFKRLDSQFLQGNQDPAQIGRSPTKRIGKTPLSGQKPKKTSTAKGRKPLARRPKQ
jgi:hypothetical protein